MTNFGIVHIRPTLACPHSCSHCYLSSDARKNSELMTLSTFRDTISFLNTYIYKEQIQKVKLIWHGGEPLAIPMSWYQQVYPELKKISVPFQEYIQTSLLSYSTEIENFIRERLHGRIGVSFDLFSRSINNSAEQYQKTWLSNKNKVLKAGFTYRILTTVTKEVLALSAKEFNIRILEFSPSIKLSRYLSVSEADPNAITNAEYSDFLIRLFDQTLHDFEAGLTVPGNSTLVGAISGILMSLQSETWGTGCLVKPNYVIDALGNVSYCLSSTETDVGSIYSDYADIQQHMMSHRVIGAHKCQKAKVKCMSCEYREWCLPNCPIPSIVNGDTECQGYKKFLDHVTSLCSNSKKFDMLIKYREFTLKQIRDLGF